MEVAIVFSKSQSAKMMLGFFPPSSSDNFLNMGAAVAAIFFPVTVPPVNEIAATPGCSTIACPAFAPRPCTMFNTPLGKPASTQSFENKKAVMGVSSEGLPTTVHPAAKAGAIFQVNKYSGRFQGEMQPATPMGA